MTYPNAPNFVSGSPGAGWWNKVGSGGLEACQTQGNTLIKAAQRYVREHGPNISRVFGDSSATRLSIVIDGVFGPNSCKVLYATLRDAYPESPLLAEIEHDYETNNRTNTTGGDVSQPGVSLSPGTVRALIWAAQYPHDDPSTIQPAPAGTVFPRWGVAPANDSGAAGQVLCWRPGFDPVPAYVEGGGAATSSNSGSTSGTGGAITTTTSTAAAPWSTTKKLVVGGSIAAGALALIGGAALLGSKKGKRKRRSFRGTVRKRRRSHAR